MRVYESGAIKAAKMINDPNCPFLMYQFPDMAQPAMSELPVIDAQPAGREVKRKPAGHMKRPAQKRPAAVLKAEDAEDDVGVIELDAQDAEEDVGVIEDDARVPDVPLHAFQITSTVTSLPVRSYLQACKCSNPDAGYSSHKKQLISEWYERDHRNHRDVARGARDFIIQNKLSWEQARDIKRLMRPSIDVA